MTRIYSKTDVLLIYPPETYNENDFHRDFQIGIGGIPMGILYIASYLRKEGISADIYDARTDFDFDLIRKYKAGNPFRFGATEDRIRHIISETRPKIIGISCMFLTRVNDALLLCDLIKEYQKDIYIVLGGASCSILKEELLMQSENVDAVVLGEGEEVFNEFVSRLLQGDELSDVDSIIYRKHDQIISKHPFPAVVKDLQAMPEPDYQLLEMEKYFQLLQLNLLPRISWIGNEMNRAVSITTSRGCPYRCIFCTRKLHNTLKWRSESPQSIAHRIQRLKNDYNISHIYFEDDSANISIERFESILDHLIEMKLDITWSAPNGIRAEGLSEKIVKKCVDSGCISLQVGIESGDQKILNNVVKKRLDLEEVIRGIRACHKFGLDIGAFFIIGFPGETYGNIFNTIKLILKLNFRYLCRIHLSVASPMRGTELHELSVNGGYLKKVTEGWKISDIITGKAKSHSKIDVIETEHFSYPSLKRIHTVVMAITFLNLVAHSFYYLLRNRKNIHYVYSSLSKNKEFRLVSRLKPILFRFFLFPHMVKKPSSDPVYPR